ncbi:Uncharacterised protein [Neisseria meningitidis]|nr:Uncharacterised protein [Neisseria meningitidis]
MIGITTERVALPETCLYLRPGRFAFNNRLCDSLFRLIIVDKKIRKRRQAADSKNSTGTDSLVFSTLENRSL